MQHLNFSGESASGKTTMAQMLFDGFLGERKEWVSGECTIAYVRAALRTCDVLVLDDVGLGGGRTAELGGLVSGVSRRLSDAVAEAKAAGRLRCKLLITTSESPIVLLGAQVPEEGTRAYMAMAQTL